jgi:hypothetical protein
MRVLIGRRHLGASLGLLVVVLGSACFLRRDAAGPTVEIVSPPDGAVVASSDVEIHVEVNGVRIAPADDQRDPSTGHLHLYIDRKPPEDDAPIPAGDPHIIHTGRTAIRARGLSPGEHTLYVVLGYGDHRPFRPAVQDSVTVTVAGSPVGLEILTPRDGATVFGPNVTVRLNLEAPGVEVRRADGTREQSSGHFHLFVDRPPTAGTEPIPAGRPGILHSASPELELQGLAPGRHTVHALFGYGDHSPYRPTLSATATFTVSERPPPRVKILAPRPGEAGLLAEVTVRLAVEGIAIDPADGMRDPSSGHIHLIMDRDLPPTGGPIPTGVDGIIHTASLETTLPPLAPGRHTLAVVLGHGDHSRIPGVETPSIRFVVGAPPPPPVTVDPAVVEAGRSTTVKGTGFAPEEPVSLVLFSDDLVALRLYGRADPRGDASFSANIPEGTEAGTYIFLLEGSSRAKGVAAVRVVAATDTGAEIWRTVKRFRGSGNFDTEDFEISGEAPWRIVWTHRPAASPAYLFIDAQRTGATTLFDPEVSSWRPERGERLVREPGRYYLRILADSEWEIEIQVRET